MKEHDIEEQEEEEQQHKINKYYSLTIYMLIWLKVRMRYEISKVVFFFSLHSLLFCRL